MSPLRVVEPWGKSLDHVEYPQLHLQELEVLALALGGALQEGRGARVYLTGELGSGKTTFCQFLITHITSVEHVPSPSYGLVTPYSLPGVEAASLYHMDCYRMQGAGELAWLGLDDIDAPSNLLLVEWPERASAMLPLPDILLQFTITDLHANQDGNAPRSLCLDAFSQRGCELLTLLPRNNAADGHALTKQ